MLKKKIIIILTLIFFTGCEYKPFFSSFNKLNYKIIKSELTGDKKLNKFLVENLIRDSKKNSSEIVNIKISTKYTKSIVAKDAAGNVTDYQAIAITTFLINRNETSKTFIVNEKFNFQKMTDKYEEKNYERNIKKNLANSISEKLILRLAVIK